MFNIKTFLLHYFCQQITKIYIAFLAKFESRQQAQEVAPGYCRDVRLRIASISKLLEDYPKTAAVLKSLGSDRNSVKIRTESDMLRTDK